MQKQILDLVELQRQLDESEIYEDEDGNKTQTVYLGSILDLKKSDSQKKKSQSRSQRRARLDWRIKYGRKIDFI